MKRRSTTGSMASPKKGRKITKSQRRITPATASRKPVSVSDFEDQTGHYLDELREAREQQAASAEILKVINSSRGNLAPVFDVILEKAHSLCHAPCGSLQLYDGEQVRAVAVRGMTEAFEKVLRQGYSVTDQMRRSMDPRRVIQNVDLAERLERMPDEPALRAAVELGGIRTMVSVPLVRDDVALGRIVAARQEVRPFTDHQIALLQSFADQAVIAIENARLFNETQEALERQTATAEILKVIASSPSDVQPVFEAIAEQSNRLLNGLATAV
jgi:GAF domain-containing protein